MDAHFFAPQGAQDGGRGHEEAAGHKGDMPLQAGALLHGAADLLDRISGVIGTVKQADARTGAFRHAVLDKPRQFFYIDAGFNGVPASGIKEIPFPHPPVQAGHVPVLTLPVDDAWAQDDQFSFPGIPVLPSFVYFLRHQLADAVRGIGGGQRILCL